jgi:hypothetical protein
MKVNMRIFICVDQNSEAGVRALPFGGADETVPVYDELCQHDWN